MSVLTGGRRARRRSWELRLWLLAAGLLGFTCVMAVAATL